MLAEHIAAQLARCGLAGSFRRCGSCQHPRMLTIRAEETALVQMFKGHDGGLRTTLRTPRPSRMDEVGVTLAALARHSRRLDDIHFLVGSITRRKRLAPVAATAQARPCFLIRCGSKLPHRHIRCPGRVRPAGSRFITNKIDRFPRSCIDATPAAWSLWWMSAPKSWLLRHSRPSQIRQNVSSRRSDSAHWRRVCSSEQPPISR
jgi:hypothetical protein